MRQFSSLLLSREDRLILSQEVAQQINICSFFFIILEDKCLVLVTPSLLSLFPFLCIDSHSISRALPLQRTELLKESSRCSAGNSSTEDAFSVGGN